MYYHRQELQQNLESWVTEAPAEDAFYEKMKHHFEVIHETHAALAHHLDIQGFADAMVSSFLCPFEKP